MGCLALGFGVSKFKSLSIVVPWMATHMHVVTTMGGGRFCQPTCWSVSSGNQANI